MIHDGDLQHVVTEAVLGMLAESDDAEIANALLKDGARMTSATRLVFQLLSKDVSREDFLRYV